MPVMSNKSINLLRMKDKEVIIIGGGLAGLTSIHLSKEFR
jgi:monoamine oxidase